MDRLLHGEPSALKVINEISLALRLLSVLQDAFYFVVHPSNLAKRLSIVAFSISPLSHFSRMDISSFSAAESSPSISRASSS